MPQHIPIFDARNTTKDVFVRLEYVKKRRMHFDELLSAFKNDLSEKSLNFVALYIHRSAGSYVVVARFRTLPDFPASFSSKIKSTVLTQEDLEALGEHHQLYTLNDKGCPVLAYIPSQYGINYFFNQRKVKQNEGLSVLNVHIPNEYVASLDFAFANAIFTLDEEPIYGETFYVSDEWSRDVRVTINDDAELAYSTADEFNEVKSFRDYKVNDMVLVKYAGYVRRGSVLSCANNICEVLCVDYGVKLKCSSGQLRIAPPNVAYTRFLAIPCVLNGIGRDTSKKVRKYVNEVLNLLDRTRTEIVPMGKDEKSLQIVDILFEDKFSKEKISIAKYLEKAGLIKAKTTSEDRVYDFSTMLKMIAGARKLTLSDHAAPIQRPFIKPSEFLAKSSLAKKLDINA